MSEDTSTATVHNDLVGSSTSNRKVSNNLTDTKGNHHHDDHVNPMEHAAWVIQSSYRHYQHVQQSKVKLLSSVQTHHQINTLARLITTLTSTTAAHASNSSSHDGDIFEQVQSLLFSEAWMKSLASVLQALPKDPLVKEKHSVMALVKNISSAILIAHFPQDCLQLQDDSSGSSEPSTPTLTPNHQLDLQIKAKHCHVAATWLHKYTLRLIQAILYYIEQPKTSVQKKRYHFSKVISQYKFTMLYFLKTFQQWKALDVIRMVQSLEDTFLQAYTALIASRIQVMQQQASIELVHAAEYQVKKIQDMLLKMVGGAKGALRLEEICAEVEASFPEYAQLLQAQAQASSTSSTASQSSSLTVDTSNEGNAVSAAISPTPSAITTSTTASTSNTNQVEEAKAMRYLEMLSDLAGMENERLAHEITLDRHYRLPLRTSASATSSAAAGNDDSTSGLQSPTTPSAIKDSKSLALFMKRQFLSAMGDKLINSLRTSNLHDVKYLVVDMIIPVRITSPALHPNIPSIPRYSAKVVAINREEIIGDEADSVLGIVSIDVEYPIEKSVEQHVSIDRIVLDTDAIDAIPLIEALQDICRFIASLTPRRVDIQQAILHCFDAELLQQILRNSKEHSSSNILSHDIYPILQTIFQSVQQLQAEFRVEENEKWWKVFSVALLGSSNTSTNMSAHELQQAEQMKQQAKRRYVSLTNPLHTSELEEGLPLLPYFFEKMTEHVEDIQRDMANYYISMLVPILEQHGQAFLTQRFVKRLQMNTTSIHRTAQCIAKVLMPTTAFDATIADLLEAEVLTTQTMVSLQDLSNPSINNDFVKTVVNPGIVAKSILSLLQLPVRLDNTNNAIVAQLLPETLSWDGSRLSVIRDLVDIIALESSIVITSRQILHKYGVSPRENEEIELQHRLDVLLSSPSSFPPGTTVQENNASSDNNDISIANIVIEVVKYVQFAIYRTREASLPWMKDGSSSSNASTASHPPALVNPTPTASAPLLNYDMKELHDRVEKSIRDVVSENSPVLALFTKRVYKVLLRAMLDKAYLPKLASYSLQSKGQERNLAKLIESTVKLFRHTWKVHGEVYQHLIASVASTALSAAATNTTEQVPPSVV